MTAAGPWIRVDSGNRPGDEDEVLAYTRRRVDFVTYYAEQDHVVGDSGAWAEPMTEYVWWARIVPPDATGATDLAAELARILEYAEMRAETAADVAAVVRRRIEEMSDARS